MERMGHSSARAALIYQHATQERDEAIAAGHGQAVAAGAAQHQSKRGSGHGTAIGHATGTRPETRLVKISQKAMIMFLTWAGAVESGRRESNPHDQLGRLGLCH